MNFKVFKAIKGRCSDQFLSICLEELKRYRKLSIPQDLTYVQGRLFDEYIHDMKLTQCFAFLNRKAMTRVILEGLGLTEDESDTSFFTTQNEFFLVVCMLVFN